MPEPLPPASWLAAAFREGKSARKALVEFRAAGGRVGNVAWFRVAGEVRSALENRARIAGLDPELLPDPADFTPWSAGRPGLYVYQIEFPYRVRGTDDVLAAPFSITTDRIMSPQTAIDEAWGIIEANLQDERYELQVMQGGILTGLYQYTGR